MKIYFPIVQIKSNLSQLARLTGPESDVYDKKVSGVERAESIRLNVRSLSTHSPAKTKFQVNTNEKIS